jgi:hypothetical protein
MKPQHPRRPTLRTTPDATAAPQPPSSYRYLAGWGEDGALDAIRAYAHTIDTIARRIEAALDPKPEPTSDAVEAEALAA